MERIRKALELANQERAKLAADGAAAPAPAATPAASTATAVAADGTALPTVQPMAPAADLSGTGLRYRLTKVVDVPQETLLASRLIAAVPGHKNREAYRMLRTRVLQTLRNNGWNSVAVTGPASGCGKTLTAINLAISLAAEVSSTVLLVDLDLRSPSVHRYFSYEPEQGLSDYLKTEMPLHQILFSPGIERLVVLPGREAVVNSAETLRSPRMVALVNELKSRYPDRIVVFDLPPILAADDALSFAPYTDSVLMVAEAGNTRKEDLQKAYDLLKGTPLLGTVLNRSDTQSAGYGYGYGAPKEKRGFFSKGTAETA
ncbi:MAG: CpsD/CapB family tyrosine-protein kinase [Chromatiales bacterium]|nr:CpsD/CapB family tyrosine-protein kinase [Chromatiales bacterium]